MKNCHLVEEYTYEDGKTFITLDQHLFKHVIIDNSSGKWEAWLDDPEDTENETCPSLVGEHETSEDCFNALAKYYDDNLITPKKLKTLNIRIFDITVEQNHIKLKLFFNFFINNKSVCEYTRLKQSHKYLKSLNVNFDLLLAYHSEYDRHTVDFDVGDYPMVCGEFGYISDRFKCHHRIHKIKTFLEQFK